MKPLVVESIDAPDGARCVDIFQRADGSFGFEEYRRDIEDQRGWFAIGGHAARRFDSAPAARREAATRVTWFGDQSSD
jgi:hypothetical protein